MDRLPITVLTEQQQIDRLKRDVTLLTERITQLEDEAQASFRYNKEVKGTLDAITNTQREAMEALNLITTKIHFLTATTQGPTQ